MSYKQGIVKAITELQDRNGSSMVAIKKIMKEKLPKDKKWKNATFLKVLKAGVKKGEFVKNKNSYKLSADFKKATIAKKKKDADTKAAAKKVTAATKKITTEPLLFELNGTEIPGEIMTTILSFLSKQELVHSASLVNSTWRSASENPFLWPSLKRDIWKKPTRANGGTMTSMKRFLELLHRPQFIHLKSLTPPDFYIYRTLNRGIWGHMAEACPHLEELDLTRTSMYPFDDEFPRLPVIFPRLQRFKFNPQNGGMMHSHFEQFVQLMGGRLLELEVEGVNALTSTMLKALSQACPNLQTFSYAEYSEDPIMISAPAVTDLIKTCSNLKSLTLKVWEEDEESLYLLDTLLEFETENREKYPSLHISLLVYG